MKKMQHEKSTTQKSNTKKMQHGNTIKIVHKDSAT